MVDDLDGDNDIYQLMEFVVMAAGLKIIEQNSCHSLMANIQ
jgi:hypothetical protein